MFYSEIGAKTESNEWETAGMNSMAAHVSGFHLLDQYMDQKPNVLACEVKSSLDAGGVVWRKPPSSEGAGAAKARWSNLDFLGKGKARRAWEEHWPQDGHRFAWDAIGRVQIGTVGWEWLLVTAFAHPEELEQSPEGPIDEADERIVSAIEEAKRGYNVEPRIDWIHSHVYLTTRLAALSFLRKHGVCVRMLLIHFYGDERKRDSLCPGLREWHRAIMTAEWRLGLAGKSVLERRVFRAFLPAMCD